MLLVLFHLTPAAIKTKYFQLLWKHTVNYLRVTDVVLDEVTSLQMTLND